MNSNLLAGGHGATIEQIKRSFSSFTGGDIELAMDNVTGIATLCLNNPNRKNAMSGHMMTQLSDLLTQLEQWQQGKAMVIYGANEFFCSGGDMNTVKSIDNSEGGRQMGTLMHSNLTRIQQLPLISLALVQGKALGGGAEMTTACDFRLMTTAAEIGFVHVRLGVTVGFGGGARLVGLVGATKALQMMTLGKRLSATECLEIKLIDGILPETDANSALVEAKKWLQPYIAGPTETVRAIKSIVQAARSLPLQDALAEELRLFASVWGGSAHKQALTQNIKHR